MRNTKNAKLKIDVQSEIGQLDAVLLHTPGPEVENMTPRMAQRALYSDILNLSIARKEYEQIEGVLSKVARTYQVRDLLSRVLDKPQCRQELISKICIAEQAGGCFDTLMAMSTPQLVKALIEGLPAKIETLTAFLNEDYYSLFPLYNFYFTRDSSVTIGGNALICRMANQVRAREAMIMDAIYRNSGAFECGIIDLQDRTFLEIYLNAAVYSFVSLIIPAVIAGMYFTIIDKNNTIRLMNYRNVVTDQPVDVREEQKVTLFDNNGVLKMVVNLENLYYIEANDNYVIVWYTDSKGAMKKYMIRCRLKTIEESFKGSSLVRCHRQYIINIDKVKVLRKEKDGYELVLDSDLIAPIPVTKTYSANVLSMFNDARINNRIS